MSESEFTQGKSWIEDRLRTLATKAGIDIEKVGWGQAGEDFSRDLYSLKFEVEGHPWIERFSRENIEDCPNDRQVRQKLGTRIEGVVKAIVNGVPSTVLSGEESAVLEDLFTIFSNDASYPPSLEFEIEQKKRGRIRAFDALLGKGAISHDQGKIGFAPRWYFASRWGLEDKAKISSLVPILTEMFMDKPTGMHPVAELNEQLRKHDRIPLKPNTIQRLLRVMQWIGLLGGYNDQTGDGGKAITEFQISQQILRCEDIEDYIASYYPSHNPQNTRVDVLKSLVAETVLPQAPAAPAKKQGKKTRFLTAFDSYEEVVLVGQGGSGRVFKVRNVEGQFYAIKVLDSGKVTTDKVRRFRNEMGFCRKNSHPNIVPVLEDGFLERGEMRNPFCVMPFYERSLRRRMKDGLKPAEVLPVFSQILDGVEAAHKQNVVHRDLKPENILITDDGRVAITDFGIARFDEDDLLTAVETDDQERLANFRYAAPEQREKGPEVDCEADIFALGLILNELFTGMIPLGTDYVKIGAKVPEFAYLDELVEWMMRQDPLKRPKSIALIKAELIRRGNTFVSHQRLSELQKKVIPASELDDELVTDPPRLTGFDYQRGKLTLFLSRPVNEKWIIALRNMGTYECMLGKEPERFAFSGASAIIGASDEREVQAIINQFKAWLPLANRKYQIFCEDEQRDAALAAKKALEQELAEEGLRQKILRDVKI